MLLVLLAMAATIPAGAAEPPTLGALRAERATLLRRIAALTDDAVRAQARAVRAGERRALAVLAVEEARRRVARFAVDAYVDGVQAVETDQLRRKGWAEAASRTDRYLFAVLAHAKAEAEAEHGAADQALEDARRTTEELQVVRAQLEKTIAEREATDRAAAEARRKAAGTKLGARPRFARTTRAQGALFARYPFGAVAGIPAGLVPTGESFTGKASWYGPGFDGRPTASGAIFDQEGPTVAHRALPLGTILLLSRGGRQALVLVNDRGPFVGGRVLDLSHGVAAILGTVSAGVATVTAQVLVEG